MLLGISSSIGSHISHLVAPGIKSQPRPDEQNAEAGVLGWLTGHVFTATVLLCHIFTFWAGHCAAADEIRISPLLYFPSLLRCLSPLFLGRGFILEALSQRISAAPGSCLLLGADILGEVGIHAILTTCRARMPSYLVYKAVRSAAARTGNLRLLGAVFMDLASSAA